MKKSIIILILLCCLNNLFAKTLNQNETLKHSDQYHSEIIEGEWQYIGEDIQKTYTHKDAQGNNHYIYSCMALYKRYDYFSCNEHLADIKQKVEFSRFATTEEIKKYERSNKIYIILLLAELGIVILLTIKNCKDNIHKKDFIK